MHCPLCRSIDTGKVGTGQYYCWHCLHEFCLHGQQGFTAFYVDAEGSLIALSELAQGNQGLDESLLG